MKKVIVYNTIKNIRQRINPLFPNFIEVIDDDKYYDAKTLKDKHTELGGSSVKFGFGECCLPIVLSHNTPNDSISHLWAYEWAKFRGLFPRLPRHWETKNGTP